MSLAGVGVVILNEGDVVRRDTQAMTSLASSCRRYTEKPGILWRGQITEDKLRQSVGLRLLPDAEICGTARLALLSG